MVTTTPTDVDEKLIVNKRHLEMLYIVQSCDDDHVSNIILLTKDSKDSWDKLDEIFEPKNTRSKVAMMHEFKSRTLEDNEYP